MRGRKKCTFIKRTIIFHFLTVMMQENNACSWPSLKNWCNFEFNQWHTCEQSEASSWNLPLTKSQYSLVVIEQAPWIPIQHGWAITSHTMCSAVLSRRNWVPTPLTPRLCTTELGLRHIGHLVMSSGHSYGAIEAGASQYLGSRPHTDPEILPPGPASPADHFFHVEMVFYNTSAGQSWPKFVPYTCYHATCLYNIK
jgi:hypothetical protein